MKKLLLVSPVPPPYSGMERATQLILDCRISEAFEILQVDSSAKSKDNDTRGIPSVGKVVRLLMQLVKIIWLSLVKRPDVALTPLAQNKVGFVKCGLTILAVALCRVPVVTWMGGSAFDKFLNRQGRCFQFFVRFCLNRLSHVIVRGYNQIGQFDGLVRPELISVVYNPRLPKVDYGPGRRQSPGKNLRVLYMSYISKAKGALDALEAIGILRAKGVFITATMAGDVIDVEKNIVHIDNPVSTSHAVNEIMRKFDLHDAVHLPGFLGGKEKERAYAEHDIFLFPSYSEAAPFAILEAVANGLPIVATPVGNLPELLEGEEDILYCNVGDPESIASRLQQLVDDERLLEELPQRADRRLEERCSLAYFEETMITLLNDAAR